MKYSEIEYQRPDIEDAEKNINTILDEFEKADSASKQIELITKLIQVRRDFETMQTISSINYTVNTEDEFNDQEHNYFDNIRPRYQALIFRYYNALINSKFRKELEEKFGKHLFSIAAMNVKTFKPEIIDDLREENMLVSRYVKLMASAKINFEGEERNLTGLGPFMSSTDRETRKKASEAKWAFFESNAQEMDSLFDRLVKVRDRIAKKLGFKNFVELGYLRLKRNEYTPEMVAEFRRQVHEHIVPLAVSLKERQQKRLGMDSLHYYDSLLDYRDGNPTPKGSPEWIVENARTMYKELSGETEEFMNHMINSELMDLYNKKGKATGGYCTFIQNYKSPFIFANMNGTSDDIRVLTHEAGHAFQAYCSRNFDVPEYTVPTLEAAEIHSMGMEYITWPWMKLFFEDDTEKFKFSHLERSLLFLPYGVAVDEFQHFVYENPEATPDERNKQWREIEKKYLPFRNYEGNQFLENGGFWKQQPHIYRVPFYYIDYCLAEICAYQFWVKANEDSRKAWEDYINLCKAGGSKPYLELVELADLRSPFEKGTVKSTINHVADWLNKVDDAKL